MDKIIETVRLILEQGPEYIAATNAVLIAVIGLCLLIPGDQPEKALQGVVDFLSKFSKKPQK